MKKMWGCIWFLFVTLILLTTSASATRSLQKGDVTIQLVTPTPKPITRPLCSKLGHLYVETNKQDATCGRNGQINYKCSSCGATKTDTIVATGKHSFVDDKFLAPTCTQDGYNQVRCSTCGETKKDRNFPMLGHDYGNWIEVTGNQQERTCSRCGHKEVKTNANNTPSSEGDAVTETPTPRPFMGHSAVRATATPKKNTSTQKETNNYDYSAQEGMIEIFTTAGKVNLRKGPGKKNDIVNIVDKKNTSLGALIDAEVDSTGTVWYKVYYKNKSCWITSDYARAVIGDMIDSDDRHVGVDSEDLTDVCFSYISEAAEHYGLEFDIAGEASDDSVLMGGSSDFIEYIELTGEGYALYGIEIGDKLKTVENSMKRNGLYCASKSSGRYVFKRPCQPYSLCVNDEGFDSYVEVMLDKNKCVESISWYAYTE